MSEERIKEIDARVEELEELQKPLYTEQFALRDEKKKIYCEAGKEIALEAEWLLQYNEDYDQIYMELKNEGRQPNRISDKIYKATKADYHDSFVILGGEDDGGDYFNKVTLVTDDGDVRIKFSNTETFEKYSDRFKIDTSEVEGIVQKFKDKVVAMEKLKEIV